MEAPLVNPGRNENLKESQSTQLSQTADNHLSKLYNAFGKVEFQSSSWKRYCQRLVMIGLCSLLSLVITIISLAFPLDCSKTSTSDTDTRITSHVVNSQWYFLVHQVWSSFFNALIILCCYYGAIPVIKEEQLILLWMFEQFVCIFTGLLFNQSDSLRNNSNLVRAYNS
ncbi:hypothetical protein RFI_31422 [Reticulomyxa filosa]|uniref:Uncharacterized protein n=1 Tax=Reticulomyxa filosa TaxID=46433 RepID=X6LXA7_RETFI|nr:hypothetical protein RFI_31422 [Reticulomyxa filosa]|eukprot:ETO05976.1 hypothetical protein RFI_31422 [Reticulomyxa filosa]